jgi:6-phosphogluconate dehydrogenase (decarboxylating)
MATAPSIGLIGLGIMGRPMARNLLRAGYRLVVHDTNRAAVDELVAEGAAAGTTPLGVTGRRARSDRAASTPRRRGAPGYPAQV